MIIMLDRTVISVFGPTNAGKSTLTNILTGQRVSIVSPEPGTTTDPVSKTMEIAGLGPCVIIDTPGLDDDTRLGSAREERALETLRRTDIALFVVSAGIEPENRESSMEWLEYVRSHCRETIFITNLFNPKDELFPDSIGINALENVGIDEVRAAIVAAGNRLKTAGDSSKEDATTIAIHLVKPGDTVLLVMPQDKLAPAGRLILPQVQTIRELIDYGCTVVSTNADNFVHSLAALGHEPALIITDSQVFDFVFANKPNNVPITSFSVLFARWKGDISLFIEGAKALACLRPDSRVLIAEACTHAPLGEDIGRVKIPALIRKAVGASVRIDVVSGSDWTSRPEDYDLIIHCGACMIGRTELQNRINAARSARVPITNYGITIAYFRHILDRIVY